MHVIKWESIIFDFPVASNIRLGTARGDAIRHLFGYSKIALTAQEVSEGFDHSDHSIELRALLGAPSSLRSDLILNTCNTAYTKTPQNKPITKSEEIIK